MTSTEANFSVTFKIDGDLLTVRGNDSAEFKANLDALILSDVTDKVVTAQDAAREARGVAATVQHVQATVGQPAAVTVNQPAAAAPVAQGMEVVKDRYDNTWTYGLPDAPPLPDGRGSYVLKNGRSKAGKAYKAWMDPAKGPKPFTPGAVEAEPIWVRD